MQQPSHGGHLLRGEAPQQDFGDVMQQGGQHHLFAVRVMPLLCQSAGIERRQARATDDGMALFQRIGLPGQQFVDGLLVGKMPEEGAHSQHQQSLTDRGDIMIAQAPLVRLQIQDDLQRHKRVAQDNVGKMAGRQIVHPVFQLLEGGRGMREHRQTDAAKEQLPAMQIT